MLQPDCDAEPIKFTLEDFKKIFDSIIEREKEVLNIKQEIYTKNDSPFKNFEDGADLNNISPLQYGFTLVTKHILALKKLIDKIASGNGNYDENEEKLFVELIGDIRIYAALFYGMYMENFRQMRPARPQNGIRFDKLTKEKIKTEISNINNFIDAHKESKLIKPAKNEIPTGQFTSTDSLRNLCTCPTGCFNACKGECGCIFCRDKSINL